MGQNSLKLAQFHLSVSKPTVFGTAHLAQYLLANGKPIQK